MRRGASLAAAAAASAVLLAGGFAASAEAQQAPEAPPAPTTDWPVYTRAEVAKHKTRESRIWMTYKVRRARDSWQSDLLTRGRRTACTTSPTLWLATQAGRRR